MKMGFFKNGAHIGNVRIRTWAHTIRTFCEALKALLGAGFEKSAHKRTFPHTSWHQAHTPHISLRMCVCGADFSAGVEV